MSSYYTVNIIHRVFDAIKFRKLITLVSGAFIQGVSVTCIADGIVSKIVFATGTMHRGLLLYSSVPVCRGVGGGISRGGDRFLQKR